MPFDGSVLYTVKTELQNKLIGGKIDKIYQPQKTAVILKIRNKGSNYSLIISANPQYSRINLTTKNYSNPQSPPMFCMVLRKHLQNGRILNLYQPGYERILEIEIESVDDMGLLSKKTLVAEIMGKHSNIILKDNKEKIIDCIKKIPASINTYRAVIPKAEYVYPPNPGKKNPLKTSNGEFKQLIFEKKGEMFSALFKSYNGISPLAAKEICLRAKIDPYTGERHLTELDKLFKSFSSFFEIVKQNSINPVIYKAIDNDNNLEDFYVFPLKCMEKHSQINFPSISEALDFYYTKKEYYSLFRQKQSNLLKLVKSKLERSEKKLSIQQQQYYNAKDAEKYKLYGELITANIYKLKKGLKETQLPNYYEDNKLIKIKLNPKLTPAENAQKYFKDYDKLKKTRAKVKKQISYTKKEIEYLNSVLYNIYEARSLEELVEIRDELIQEGYLKQNKKSSARRENKRSKPRRFVSSDGFTILVGRNNKQNDYLTMKIASSDDLWFHTKHIPGSHVIVKTEGNTEVPKNTLLEAAALAGYFSKARESSNVAIDFTEKKNVRKPKGSKPGMVIYDNYQTIYITPTKYHQKIKALEDN